MGDKMINNEVKQAIRDAATEAWKDCKVQSADYADAVLQFVEAKLSPKHPPKGAICEVWDKNRKENELAVSTGDGRFQPWEDSGQAVTVDHYRVIPTAADALDEITIQLSKVHDEAFCDYRGLGAAERYIQDLIDNAEEG